MTSPSPHLCAHLAYGSPCLDIAYPLMPEGTESDPGPWWITSAGHRLRPYWTIELSDLCTNESWPGEFATQGIMSQIPDPPDDAEESWAFEATRSPAPAELMALLGLTAKPKPPTRRI